MKTKSNNYSESYKRTNLYHERDDSLSKLECLDLLENFDKICHSYSFLDKDDQEKCKKIILRNTKFI